MENKPWAQEQEDQVGDYVAHLRRKFAGNFIVQVKGGCLVRRREEMRKQLEEFSSAWHQPVGNGYALDSMVLKAM